MALFLRSMLFLFPKLIKNEVYETFFVCIYHRFKKINYFCRENFVKWQTIQFF